MCSKIAKKVAQSDLELNQAQTAMTNALNQDYSLSFAQNQRVLGQQQAKLQAITSNPMGYSPQELHTMTSSINENTANAAKQAMGAAAAFAAAHGAADTGAGPTGMVAGQIAEGAAQSKATQLANLSLADQNLKRQNFWTAMSGLSGVGQGYNSAAGGAISGAGETAGSAVNAGTGAVSASNIVAQDIGGILGGAAGLASAGVGAYGDFTKAHG